MKSYKWNVLTRRTTQKKETQNNTEEILDILMKNRGIKTKEEREEFLNPKLESVRIKSVGIDEKEVKKTLNRIKKAIEQNEKIIIYGDYDVDGICGTAILWETIYSFYKNVEPYIPHRVDEGYGLSIKGIENLKFKILNSKEKIGLIITVDNGIVADKAIDFANENGIDVVITDHHVRSKIDPKAYSIVHTTNLCGTGVAYLLSKELLSVFSGQLSESSQPVISESVSKQTNRKLENHNLKTENRELITDTHLELVALATVADLVPLVGPNRTLLKFGLQKLRQTQRPGLIALFSEAKIKKEEIDTYHIGHIIAPRLNASGRITHALDSLRLICTKNASRAKEIAQNLGEVNRTRQNFTLDSTTHADTAVVLTEKIIFVSDASYEEGIIGLVASRLVEKHYKPAIAVSIGGEFSKGSARSVKGFNIIEFLRTFESHMVNAGGHPMAAGFTIETAKLETFKLALIESSRTAILDKYLERVLSIDLELSFNELNLELINEMNKIAPFGMGNGQPQFVSKKVKIDNLKPVGRDQKHLKLALSQNGKKFDAIFFNGVGSGIKEKDEINVVYNPEVNFWNGNTSLQLKIKDVKVS